MQLTLSVSLRDEATFDNFVIANNALVVDALQSFVCHNNEQFIYLSGQNGVGKSHLLQACCHVIGMHEPIAYVPLKDDSSLSPDVFQNLEQMRLVAIDDIDSVLTRPEWEEALFHFYNRVRDAGTALIVSAQVPPMQLSCQLADLRSRLAWGLALHLQPLAEADMTAALQLHAKNRGFHLGGDVCTYLLNHYQRDMSALIAILDILDNASLVEKRKLSIPFCKAVLAHCDI